ncbi:MAG: TonB family protein [Saprospiraceae bacterium]|nr:TonB family protein [Saprospiraceae bacterium]
MKISSETEPIKPVKSPSRISDGLFHLALRQSIMKVIHVMKKSSTLFFLTLLSFCMNAQTKHILGEWELGQMFKATPELIELPTVPSNITFLEDGKVAGSLYSTKSDGTWKLEESLLTIAGKTYQLLLLTDSALLIKSTIGSEVMIMAYLKGSNSSKAKTDCDAYFAQNYSFKLQWEPLFKMVETMPVMLECSNLNDSAARRTCNSEKIAAFIKENITKKEVPLEGKAHVRFIVETDGTISSPDIVRSSGKGWDEEAIRLVKLMPKWSPGKQRGTTVRVVVMQAIEFSPISEKEKKD